MVSFSYFKKWTLVINHNSSNLVCCGKCESNTRKRSIFGLLIISILYVSLCRPACCLSSSMKWNFSPLPWDDARKEPQVCGGSQGAEAWLPWRNMWHTPAVSTCHFTAFKCCNEGPSWPGWPQQDHLTNPRWCDGEDSVLKKEHIKGETCTTCFRCVYWPRVPDT